MSEEPASLRALLAEQLILARQRDQRMVEDNAKGAGIEIPIAGAIVSGAYEQLRNAAEYAEEHLLLQRAIKRFYKLNLFVTHRKVETLGRELVVELVQAGYIKNGSLGTEGVKKIDAANERYMEAYRRLRDIHVARDSAMEWVLAFMSVETTQIIAPNSSYRAIVFLAYNHFLQSIHRERFMHLPESGSYELCLYLAVHQALLKSDVDIVRHELFELYQLSVEDTKELKSFNEQIDRLFEDELTQRLRRVVSRYGAPLRILKSLINERTDTAELLQDKDLFMDTYRSHINQEYQNVKRRLNKGVVRSIIFLLITKALIGLAIEIPYDLLVYGTVAIIPLMVNLLFPPLYMAGLRLGLRTPTAANAQTLYQYMENLLYGSGKTEIYAPEKKRLLPITRVLYALIFTIPIIVTILLLEWIGFNIVQMMIFFVFFSTASSLGFRLSGMIRDLELTEHRSGMWVTLRDFFYLPFIMTGQWLSRKYSKLNIVARFLDVAIELPLKAILRLIRQWIGFLNEKRDELY